MPQRPLGERAYSRSPQFFLIIEGRVVQHGEAEPSCLWRSSKEWLMLVPSTRRRFTDLARRYVAVIATLPATQPSLRPKPQPRRFASYSPSVTSPSSLASWPALHAAGRRPASIDQESDSKRLWGHNRPSEPLLWAVRFPHVSFRGSGMGRRDRWPGQRELHSGSFGGIREQERKRRAVFSTIND
jgi:hypothetical protein